MDNEFLIAIKNGNINTIKEIYEKYKSVLNLNNKIFHVACENGHIKIAKWLLGLSNSNININSHNDYAFILTCENGHIDTAKWLLSLPNNNININSCNDYAFRLTCRNGHIDTAKWLLSLPNNNININSYDNYAFRSACENGHIETVRWLLSLPNNNISIKSEEDDEVFSLTCYNNHIEIIQLLISTKQISNAYINKIISNTNELFLTNSLIEVVFDNYYYPINDIMFTAYYKYKNNKTKIMNEIINNDYLIADLWNIIYDY